MTQAQGPSPRRGLAYRVAVIGALVVALVVLFWLAADILARPSFMALDDYVEYWTAARLNMTGGNPYDPDQMEALQRQIGRAEQVPIMMWNPPWTLALLMPLSLFAYPSSRLLWLLLNLGAVMWCAGWLWTCYGGAPEKRWVAWLAAFTFGPLLHAIKAGQISPLLLLGVAAFFFFVSKGWEWAAGASLILCTFKPHLVYLVGLAVFLWAVHQRRWRVLVGAAAALVIAMGVAWLVNPALVSQYRHALAHYPPEQWATPTLGGVLRLVLGTERFWLQFLPSAVGAVWMVAYWLRHRGEWRWARRLPVVLLVSVVTAAYGWTFDQVVLIPALLPAAMALAVGGWRTQTARKAALVVGYVLIDGFLLFSSMVQIWYWWQAPFFLLWYLAAQNTAGLSGSGGVSEAGG